MSTINDGGLTVTEEMRRILAQPGPLTTVNGGHQLRQLYCDGSLSFDKYRLSSFGFACYAGLFTQVRMFVECGMAPPLHETETPYEFGYATITVAGGQRMISTTEEDGMKHVEVLKYLISKGMPVDVPDIVGQTALYHCTASNLPRVDLARILITVGNANVNHQSRYGEAALTCVFQHNNTEAIDLLMEHGADVDIPDADGITARTSFLRCGPQVTACITKWLRQREGTGDVSGEKRGCVCGKAKGLHLCSQCKVARYCSRDCQRNDWQAHKKVCVPFVSSNTVTVKPFYTAARGHLIPTGSLVRSFLGIQQPPPNPKHARAFHTPPSVAKGLKDKDMIVKVQVPFNLFTGGPAVNSVMDLLVYSKNREFVCSIRRCDGLEAYDRIAKTVKEKGVGGAKAYFAATLKSEQELVVKVGDVLAEQPF